MTDYTILRDYYDRPLVWSPLSEPLSGLEKRSGKARNGGSKVWYRSADAVGYSRASGAGKDLDSKEGLLDWAAAQSAVGVVLDDGARSDIATLINEYDADPWNKGDDGSARSGKDRLKDAVSRARNTAGSAAAASAGTEFHKLAELVNAGKTPRVVQDHLRPLLDQYVDRVSRINFLNQELFIVNDVLELAGSVDYLLELPDGMVTPDGVRHDDPLVVAGDLKTGRWDFRYPMGVTCQVAAYGRGVCYDQSKNERSQLHDRINTDWGLLVHFPIMTKNPDVGFYWLDLNHGMRAAAVGRSVAEVKKSFNRKDAALKELVW